MLSQLSMMEADMRNANAAMAGELYPLAQQKATTVIHEGRDIAAYSYNNLKGTEEVYKKYK
ncbi:hypothetical protein ANCCEY_14286 [Ancylostoma ceylanicum]|uniref:Uncharacterized protein n=1 Tax=Ancylostoma ceylanicum TaxID=53326 RepID=A0A0D6LG32_9BILA|nr:hypothetical protein ANCCEY_14286 [Ancylostoma ceylanicum]